MADVLPFKAVHFDPARVESVEAVLAPPYDVIDASLRDELLAASPHNVVGLDLPEDPDGGDRYAHAAAAMDGLLTEGVLVADEEPTIWALAQAFRAPDGTEFERHSILARVRVEEYGAGRIRAHERTQPGPKLDRLELTRATRHNLSPIFSLTSADAWPAVEAALDTEPWARTRDREGTENAIWRVTDPAVHAEVASRLADAELLIADGHHRYETARTYADEVGGESAHRYTLMALTGLDDPGLTVFPTHRVISGVDREVLSGLPRRLSDDFEVTEVDRGEVDPGGEEGLGLFGFIDGAGGSHLRLRLRDRSRLDRLLADRSLAYRELDAVILEVLVLRELLGMTEEDVEAKRGIGYAKSIEEVERLVAEGERQAGFILRSTPIEQVRAVAGAGETMPPKSTYFYPKIPTGIAFNQLR